MMKPDERADRLKSSCLHVGFKEICPDCLARLIRAAEYAVRREEVDPLAEAVEGSIEVMETCVDTRLCSVGILRNLNNARKALAAHRARKEARDADPAS